MKKKRDLLSRLPHPGQKGTPLLSRTGVPGWETGTTAVSEPGQINVFVVVLVLLEFHDTIAQFQRLCLYILRRQSYWIA